MLIGCAERSIAFSPTSIQWTDIKFGDTNNLLAGMDLCLEKHEKGYQKSTMSVVQYPQAYYFGTSPTEVYCIQLSDLRYTHAHYFLLRCT